MILMKKKMRNTLTETMSLMRIQLAKINSKKKRTRKQYRKRNKRYRKRTRKRYRKRKKSQ